MTLRRLPPVRRAVPLQSLPGEAARTTFLDHFGALEARLFGSGTQALAVAIADAMVRRGKGSGGEVVVPAYACPDLVAACVYAGARPRLVDTARDAWGYDSQALAAAIGPETLAVLAVNLFGVGDDAAGIRRAVGNADVALIQDSAQYFPTRAGLAWSGDYTVLSFGRGKPINLMGGGALLGALAEQTLRSARLAGAHEHALALPGSRLAAIAFNVMTSPIVYGVASRLPGLGVGSTRYRELDGVVQWTPATGWPRVGAGFEAYVRDASRGDEMWSRAFMELSALGIVPLFAAGASAWPDRLLRLPLLLPESVDRDAIVASLQPIGASAMYARTLPHIEAVPDEVRAQGPFPNAEGLARRLITLPTHDLVDAGDARRLIEALRKHAG